MLIVESVECVLLDIVLSIRIIVAMTPSSYRMYISRNITFVEDCASSNAAPAPSLPSCPLTTLESP
jgi:hypothetical protein